MISIRKASERGLTKLDWLNSRHTFSFGEYFDPKENGFSVLRVINDDHVAGGRGYRALDLLHRSVNLYFLANNESGQRASGAIPLKGHGADDRSGPHVHSADAVNVPAPTFRSQDAPNSPK